MDSGCAVPTLKLGLSKTLAAKVLRVTVLRAGALGVARPGASEEGRMVCVVELSYFALVRSAFFLAAESAGKSIPARPAINATTMSSSIRVKAWREESFIATSRIFDC